MYGKVIGVLVLAALIAPSTSVAAAEMGTAQIMILGVAHLEAKRDIHNSLFQDSPLSPVRQAQISDIVHRLGTFHPTKVLIEAPIDSPVFAQRYSAYVNGSYTLPANEIYQFGFRLAKLAGNSTIYPIDTFGPAFLNDNARVDAFLKANFSSVTNPSLDAFLARQDSLERTGTYLELLRYLNTDTAILASASFYSVMDGMGRGADNAGAAYVSQWYARNCYIFSNILAVIRPGDRVVVIMGQGHEYFLRELVRLNPSLVNVDPLAYLT